MGRGIFIFKLVHMKYLKLFENTASYEAYKASEDYVLPNVSYITETKSVGYNPYVAPVSPNIVCTYNVTDISKETKLVQDYALSNIVSMIVDGVEMDAYNYYQFDTVGLHTVEFILDDKTKMPKDIFYQTYELVSVEVPESITSIDGMFIYLYSVSENLSTIVFNSKNAPTPEHLYLRQGSSVNGVLKYPKGADYSAWIALLPEGWTVEEF